MKVLTRNSVKLSEENAVNCGDFSFADLMKTAGDKATEIIKANYELKNKKVAVICGNGNNGGDGFVIADNLLRSGIEVSVFLPLGKPKTENALYYFSLLPKEIIFEEFNGEFDFIIDAVFGIGLCRDLSADLIKLINELNRHTAIRIAVDIPSGIDCDNGCVLGAAFKADLTVTFIAPKPCFYLPFSTDFCGRVEIADIGVMPIDSDIELLKPATLPERPQNSHKGTFGTALLICGSYGMAGAAILATRACLKSGVGIAKCLVPKSIYPILTTAVPEAVCLPMAETLKGSLSSFINIKTALLKTDAVLFGCGLSNSKHTLRLLSKLIKNCKSPMVIDADGINALAKRIDLLKKANASVILTPHPAEMARLLKTDVKTVEQNRIKTAINFSKTYNCVLVLKGANTLVAEPTGKVYINTFGNSGMATGGSGDVLSGIMVSLLAQGLRPAEAAKTAVYLHSFSADEAVKTTGEAGLLPSDMIEAL
ncbi:MAG: NAD(P)H-hydrate dehydratase [Clostridia bacterium]|nr:NAD(P)H-hydrate dehydratase [Clostridia bacterium]